MHTLTISPNLILKPIQRPPLIIRITILLEIVAIYVWLTWGETTLGIDLRFSINLSSKAIFVIKSAITRHGRVTAFKF